MSSSTSGGTLRRSIKGVTDTRVTLAKLFGSSFTKRSPPSQTSVPSPVTGSIPIINDRRRKINQNRKGRIFQVRRKR